VLVPVNRCDGRGLTGRLRPRRLRPWIHFLWGDSLPFQAASVHPKTRHRPLRHPSVTPLRSVQSVVRNLRRLQADQPNFSPKAKSQDTCGAQAKLKAYTSHRTKSVADLPLLANHTRGPWAPQSPNHLHSPRKHPLFAKETRGYFIYPPAILGSLDSSFFATQPSPGARFRGSGPQT